MTHRRKMDVDMVFGNGEKKRGWPEKGFGIGKYFLFFGGREKKREVKDMVEVLSGFGHTSS